ncbi:unnamed protein product, partial [Polarella glacialis]
ATGSSPPSSSSVSRPKDRKVTGSGCKITFAAEPKVSEIENFSHLSEELWHDGSFMVDCDTCDSRILFGVGGSCVGAAGRPRFAQNQVVCNSCLAERLFSEIGAWLVVALASRAADGDHVELDRVAEEPVSSLVDALLQLGPGSRADTLVGLLGEEVSEAEARAEVLMKARSKVSSVLGSGVPGSPVQQRLSRKRALPGGQESQSSPSTGQQPGPADGRAASQSSKKRLRKAGSAQVRPQKRATLLGGSKPTTKQP